MAGRGTPPLANTGSLSDSLMRTCSLALGPAQILSRLSTRGPGAEQKRRRLEAIAAEHGLHWESTRYTEGIPDGTDAGSDGVSQTAL